MTRDSNIGRPSQPRCGGGRTGFVGPLIMIGIGGVFLLQNFVPSFSLGRWWPIILVVVGLGILMDRVMSRG